MRETAENHGIRVATMPVRCRFERRNDYLHVAVEGSLFSSDEMLDYLESLRGSVMRAGLSKLLVDEMKCHMHLDLDALEAVADELRNPRWFLDSLNVAVVSSSVNHPLFRHIFDPMESIKVFSGEQAARTWLDEARGVK